MVSEGTYVCRLNKGNRLPYPCNTFSPDRVKEKSARIPPYILDAGVKKAQQILRRTHIQL